MGVKISNLPSISAPALGDAFVVVQSGTTYKETGTQLSSLFATAGANSNITSLSGLVTPLSLAQGGTGVSNGNPIFGQITFNPTTQGIVGTTTNNDAGSGYVGQIVTKQVLSGASISLTTSTAANVLSQLIPQGDWDIFGSVSILSSGNLLTVAGAWTSLTSASVPDIAFYNVLGDTSPFSSWGSNTPYLRGSFGVPTTVYLSCTATFGSGTATACGFLSARRVR